MKKKLITISINTLILIQLVLLMASTTSATVTDDLDPELGAANCPAGYGLEDFESGVDRTPIASTVPGVTFITTAGQDWLTGDWTTGGYNGKYPSGSYTSGGDKWAWLGESQGEGKIDFTMGDASYVSIYTSTYSGVTFDAYKDDGTFLESSGWASSSLDTGKMTMLTISRPTADIGYIIVHDTGNYWLIDWLCTDAPGVPVPPPAAPEPTIAIAIISALAPALAYGLVRRRKE